MTTMQRQEAVNRQILLYRKLKNRLRYAVTDSEQKAIKNKMVGLQISFDVMLNTMQHELTDEQKEALSKWTSM